MGFIKVKFNEVRNVIIDGADSNQKTGEVIEVEAGLHTITLSGPPDTSPPSQDVMVMVGGSNPLNPLEVHFEKIKRH